MTGAMLELGKHPSGPGAGLRFCIHLQQPDELAGLLVLSFTLHLFQIYPDLLFLFHFVSSPNISNDQRSFLMQGFHWIRQILAKRTSHCRRCM